METIDRTFDDALVTTVALPGWVHWVSALGPAVTLLAAVVAGSLAYASLRQGRRADAKAEWWRRTQWAFDQLLTDDPARQDVGVSALRLLSASQLATREDLDLLEAGSDAVLVDVADDPRAFEQDGEAADV